MDELALVKKITKEFRAKMRAENKASDCGAWVIPYKGTLQDFMSEAMSSEITFGHGQLIFNDSHYYFDQSMVNEAQKYTSIFREGLDALIVGN